MGPSYDITIKQGATFFLLLNLKEEDVAGAITPFNATGMMFRGQVKRCPQGTTAWDFTFNPIDLSNGEVEVKMGADVTETLPAGELVYDIEVYDPSDITIVYKGLYGKATVIEEVTRS